MTTTRDERLARMFAIDQPPQTLRAEIARDQRMLEVELLRARAALKLIADAPTGVSKHWKQHAHDAWRLTK